MVDVRHDEKAKQMLVKLSKKGLGCGPTVVTTPTTLVGTELIVGSDAPAVVKAVQKQHDWKAAQ